MTAAFRAHQTFLTFVVVNIIYHIDSLFAAAASYTFLSFTR
jgi:hypothetical protein